MADTTRIPIDLMSPDLTTDPGNSWWAPVALGTAVEDVGFWHFLKDVEGRVFGKVTVPNTIGGTPAAKVILVIAANATTGNTRLQVSWIAVADGEQLNAAKTAITAETVTVPGTAYLTKEVTATLASQPAAKDIIMVEVFHDGDLAGDTLAVDTLVYEAYLEIDLS